MTRARSHCHVGYLRRGCWTGRSPRWCVEPPRIHDVSALLAAERERLPAALQPHVERLAAISRNLRRDRELSFYGAEDLTPSSFHSREDASRAREDATLTVDTVAPHVLGE